MKVVKNNDSQNIQMYRRIENKLPSDWCVESIRNICDLQNGMAFKPDEKNDQGVGLPVVRIQNLNGSNKYDYYDKSVREQFLIKSGDVLFAWSGTTLGGYLWNGGDAILNQHIFKIVPKNGINNQWLYYLFKTIITKRANNDSHGGGGLVHVNKGTFEEYLIPLPSEEEQEKIANFLSERESYLQSIQTLISKMEQRNHYYLHGLTSGELAIKDGITFENDENTNEVVLNGKTKEVPASFDEFKLGDIIQEENKSKLAVKDAIEGEYPFFNCSETLSMTHNNYLVDGNYIIMSTGGKPSIHYYEGKIAYSSDSYVISATDNVNSRYLAFLLKANMKRIERCFLGSGLKHLNKKIFKKEVYHLPDLDKQKEVADFLSKNEDEVNLVRELYSKEKQVFQWLCEKLVSGDYRIED